MWPLRSGWLHITKWVKAGLPGGCQVPSTYKGVVSRWSEPWSRWKEHVWKFPVRWGWASMKYHSAVYIFKDTIFRMHGTKCGTVYLHEWLFFCWRWVNIPVPRIRWVFIYPVFFKGFSIKGGRTSHHPNISLRVHNPGSCKYGNPWPWIQQGFLK